MPTWVYVRKEENNLKMRETALRNIKNWKHVMPPSRKWKHWSEDDKKRISESNKEHWKNNPNPNLWKPMSEEQKEKISKAHLNRNFVRKQPLYKIIRWLKRYSEWRTDIFSRDNYTCQTCFTKWWKLQSHHIKSLAQIISDNKITNAIDALSCEELWDLNNGVTLCEECHKLTDNYMHKWHLK